MKLTISLQDHDNAIGVEVSEHVLLHDFKAYVEAETGIAIEKQILFLNNLILSDNEKTLSQLGMTDGDLLLLSQVNRRHESRSIEMHSAVDRRIEATRLEALSNPLVAEQLHRNYPQLGDALHEQSRFRSEMLQHLQEIQKIEGQHLGEDDPESQARILSQIRQQRIEENLELAYHIAPESFVAVSFLYIRLEINGHEAFGLVDSGSQKTTIHSSLAEEFGILDLIDTRFASMTVGTGTQKSKGRIHNVAVKLGETNVDLPCSFTVLDLHVGILFGLDMLRRHKCSIDLDKDALVISGQEIKFLTESEIEKHVRQFPSSADEYLTEKKALNQSEVKAGNDVSTTSTPEQSNSINTTSGGFSEESIAQIMSLGFSRKEAVSALQSSNGNVDLAASSFF